MSNETGALARDVQTVFLNGARREQLDVSIRLTDGTRIEGRIRGFDRFSVVVDRDGSEELIFKHAIALIRPARADSEPASAP